MLLACLARLVGHHVGSCGALQPHTRYHRCPFLIGLQAEVPGSLEVLKVGAPVAIVIGGDTDLLHVLAVGGVEAYLDVDTCHGLVLARM